MNTAQAGVYRMTAEEAVAQFGSDQRRGLTGQEAGARLQQYGPNELETEKPVPAWRRFLAQFQDSGVVTRRMWFGIAFVGLIMATGTLLVLDFGLPGGLIEGSGDLSYARTMAFTTLVLFQLFNAANARSDERSAFHRLFRNPWLPGALVLSLALQILVVYAPFLQPAFGTVALSLTDWLVCVAVASSVLWMREISKLFVSER